MARRLEKSLETASAYIAGRVRATRDFSGRSTQPSLAEFPNMTFAEVLGQEPAVTTLTRALASDKVHHAYRFEGPPGVGKALAAFALARALLCEAPLAGGLACGACGACKRSSTFGDEPAIPRHPDLLLVERGLYRSVLGAAEASGISIEQVRKIVL